MADIDGTPGDDTINGTGEADVIHGFGGADILNGQGGGDMVYGDDGDDTLISSTAPRDQLFGGDGNDHFQVSAAAYMTGGAGQDLFTIFGAAYQSRILDFEAGDGGDRLDITGFAIGNTGWNGVGNPFALGYLTLTQVGGDVFIGRDPDGGGDQSFPFLYLIGADLDDFTADNFTLSAILEQTDTSGADMLAGTPALDHFHLGAGDDHVTGGRGADTAFYSGNMAGYSLSYVEGAWIVTDIDLADGDDGIDTLREVEGLRFADGSLRLDPALSVSGEISPAGDTSFSIAGTVAVSPAGGFVTAWVAEGHVYFRLHGADGSPQGAAVDAFGLASSGSTGVDFFSDGSFIVLGQQILAAAYAPVARLFNADGTPRGAAFQITDGGVPNPYEMVVEVLPDDSFVVAWTTGASYMPADRTGHLRHYDADGTPSGAIWDLASGPGQSAINLLPVADDSFLAFWIESPANVVGQLFATDGTALGPLIPINTTPTDNFGGLSVDRLADGRVILVYSVAHSMIGQFLDPDTGDLSGEFVISSSDFGPRLPDVAALDDGGFVAVWEGSSFNGRFAVAQRFDAGGGRVGEEIIVSISGAQSDPAVAAMPGGGWVTVFEDAVGSTIKVSAATYGGPAIVGGEGDDTIHGGAGGDTISGGGGDDALLGGAGADILHGGGGGDLLDGGAGADRMAGGAGDDTFLVDDSGDRVIEAADQGRDAVYSSISYTLAAGTYVEVLSTDSIAGTGAIDLAGNGFNNEIYGNNGANLLNGGGGGDYLVGWGGDDIYLIFSGSEIIVENANSGRDAVYTAISYALAADTHVEALAADSIVATTAINLTGNGFNNEIYGNNGANLLNGGGGGDYLVGWGGDDTYLIFSGSEIVVENADSGRDVVYTAISYALAADTHVEVLAANSIVDTSAINLTGNGLNNEIYGNNGANLLNGGGGAGDYLVGWGGDDTYLVFTGGEIVVENASSGRDVIYSTLSYTLVAGSHVEVLSTNSILGTNAIDLTGNELGQEVYGNEGANTLNGGAGGDYLLGYGGADNFAFTTALGSGNVDILADFSAADDTILLNNNVFTGLAAGALPASPFVTGAAAGDADDRIVYNSATGQIFFDADGSGGGAQVHFATVNAGTILTASDFMVI